MMKWPVALLACLLAAGCGGGDSSNQGDDNPSSGVIIRGGERMEWDQPTDSPATARAYNFTVYVDGAQMRLSEVRCADVRTAAGVVCSGRLPSMARGAHRLELTASATGAESSRSLPLLVTVSSLAFLSGGAMSEVTSNTASTARRLVCLEATSQDCYETRLLASVDGGITWPVASEDRLFFVEGDTRVRVITGTTLETTPALTIGDGARIVGLAIARDFERSRLVFVAWSERSGGSSSETLHITRYRELQGTFGEGATIVTGLPLPSGERVPIAVDRDGLVYVALSEAILRFGPDGRVPGANPYSSPIIAHGYAHPTSLVWDDWMPGLWLSGSDPRWSNPVSTLRVDVDSRAEWPWLPVPAQAAAAVTPSRGFPLLALTTGAAPAQSRHLWLVAASGIVQRAVLGPGQRFDGLGSTAFDQIGHVVAIAGGPGEYLTVVTHMAPSSGMSVSNVWRFTRMGSSP